MNITGLKKKKLFFFPQRWTKAYIL